MPGMDGKGPAGTGPIGRGLGPCRQDNTPTQTVTAPEQPPMAGQGLGRGMGRGNRPAGDAGGAGRCRGGRGQGGKR